MMVRMAATKVMGVSAINRSMLAMKGGHGYVVVSRDIGAPLGAVTSMWDISVLPSRYRPLLRHLLLPAQHLLRCRRQRQRRHRRQRRRQRQVARPLHLPRTPRHLRPPARRRPHRLPLRRLHPHHCQRLRLQLLPPPALRSCLRYRQHELRHPHRHLLLHLHLLMRPALRLVQRPRHLPLVRRLQCQLRRLHRLLVLCRRKLRVRLLLRHPALHPHQHPQRHLPRRHLLLRRHPCQQQCPRERPRRLLEAPHRCLLRPAATGFKVEQKQMWIAADMGLVV